MKPAAIGEIEFHVAPGMGAAEEKAASLRANRIDPKFLYATPRQADLWREVFLRHSPIHANPEFTRIYREAFALAAKRMAGREILLAGLGCGTGMKEHDQYLALKAAGSHALFSAVDISRDLVEQSVTRLSAAGARHAGSLVCDLAESKFVARWLDGRSDGRARLMTFFGLIPNLAPAQVIDLLRRVIRPGDMLLASVHLAPVSETRGVVAAMRSVLPQYDNAETRAWLAVAIDEWGLTGRVDAPVVGVGEREGVPAIVGTARWKSGEPFGLWGHSFTPSREEPLRVFHSLRYTPALFEAAMRRANLRAERLALTRCGEEGIWAISAI